MKDYITFKDYIEFNIMIYFLLIIIATMLTFIFIQLINLKEKYKFKDVSILKYNYVQDNINRIIVTILEFNNKIYYYCDSDLLYYIFKDEKNNKIKISKVEIDYKLKLILQLQNK